MVGVTDIRCRMLTCLLAVARRQFAYRHRSTSTPKYIANESNSIFNERYSDAAMTSNACRKKSWFELERRPVIVPVSDHQPQRTRPSTLCE